MLEASIFQNLLVVNHRKNFWGEFLSLWGVYLRVLVLEIKWIGRLFNMMSKTGAFIRRIAVIRTIAGAPMENYRRQISNRVSQEEKTEVRRQTFPGKLRQMFDIPAEIVTYRVKPDTSSEAGRTTNITHILFDPCLPNFGLMASNH